MSRVHSSRVWVHAMGKSMIMCEPCCLVCMVTGSSSGLGSVLGSSRSTMRMMLSLHCILAVCIGDCLCLICMVASCFNIVWMHSMHGCMVSTLPGLSCFM